MNATQTAATLRAVLHEVAPEADLDTLAPEANLREVLELDSLDFLRVVQLLSEQTGHNITEAEYPKLASFASTVDFLAAA